MAIQSNFPAIKPSLLLDFANTKSLDPRITFTRASTATYYDGVTTAKAEENLFLYSQDFDNGNWSSTGGGTRTANTTTAPDGNTTADTLTASVGSTTHGFYRPQTYIAADYTLSIYAKAGTYSFLTLDFTNNTGDGATFNLSTGAIGFTNASVTSSITSVGNGWYRCVITKTMTALSGFPEFYLSSSGTANGRIFNAAGTETVFLWGAQLEQRSAVTAYTATTTQAITNYIPKLQSAASGVARFDNNPTTGESLGLLIEESRTNLLTYSAAIDNAAWTKASAAITADTAISPDGTLTADKFVCSSGLALLSGAAYQALSKAASAITYTYTFYAKAGGYNRTQIYVRDSSTSANGASAVISLVDGSIVSAASATGTFTGASATTTNVGNGWYRISITFTSGTETAIRAYVQNTDSVATTTDGFSGIYIWGAQLEAGAFATSYIPTVASQVTRSADLASMTGTNFSSWYRADEGTIFIDANGFQPALTFSNANNGYNNIRQMYRISNATNAPLNVYEANNGVASVNTQSMGNTNALTFKCAYGFKTNDFAGSVNAGTVATDTSGIPALAVDRLGIGLDYGVSATTINSGIYRKIAFYPLRVTNAQLQALTS